MILLVDNYDSFSYNLYQLAGSINPDMKVIRNDEMTIDEICALAPASIILSPGPGRPEQAGRCMEIVEKLGGEIPILGVCLGHQAICAAYGATVTYAKQLMHGKQSETTLDLTSELFQGLPETVPVARYHSLAADEATLPETLKVTARTADGVAVAKHGNRAASSKSGAADCLEALGVKIDLELEKNKEVLEKLGICFLFAQKYHMSMKYVAPVRKMLGIRTIFNILGPLTNPAAATMQVMGVYEEALVRPMAEVLSNLGVKRGMVVYGQDCLDEISLSAPTSVCEIKDGTFEEYVITPEEFGMTRCTKEELVGGTPQENAEITKEILAGKKGPARDAVVLNAAAALHVAKEIPMQDAVKLAEELIDSGKAQKKLEEFVSLANKLAEEE